MILPHEKNCPLCDEEIPYGFCQHGQIDLIRKIHSQAAEITHLKQWVNDLHSGMYINCVYCGHRYGPSDEVPASMAEVLKEHIEQCAEHPMSKLKSTCQEQAAKIAHLQAVVVVLLDHLPDSIHEDDDSWTWCWEELSGEAQDAVKFARKTGYDARRESEQ